MDPSLFCNSTNLDPSREWCIRNRELNYMVMCYKQRLSQKEGLWRAENATNLAAITFIAQLIIIVFLNRLLMVAFRAFRLPRVAAEILGGVILGGGGLGNTFIGFDYLFPHRGMMTLETVGNLSLLFYMFLVGLEIDIKPVIQAPKKAFTIALAGFLLPFPVGYALHFIMISGNQDDAHTGPTKHGPIFWAIALSTTNFPDLAQILADLKLLHSEIGRTSLSAAAITDVLSWPLLVLAVATVNNDQIITVVFGTAFVVFCVLALRPGIEWAVRRTSQEDLEEYNQFHVCSILTGVVACGYITDAFGCHSILGGFMLGLIMPKGDLKKVLMEKVEDFISGVMMPFFFLIIGLRTNHNYIFAGQFGIGTIVGILGLAFVTKIFSTFLAAVFVNKMTPRDSIALGLLMNTKGLLSLIVISSARDSKVLNNQTFAMIITALWLMTIAVVPILSFTYRSIKPRGEIQGRTISRLQPDSEFRILACFHSTREVTGIINLLDASNPTKQSPLSIFAIHLVENLGRASAMLLVHDDCKIDIGGPTKEDKNELEASSHRFAATALDAFQSSKEGAAVQILTAVSAYATMHEDICYLAEDKVASLIILPFQLKPAADGGTEDPNSLPFRGVNKNVMENSPCSVAVLVDRGHRPPLALFKSNSWRGNACHHNFLLIFVGGPDDREALVYATRMSGNHTVGITVMRFIQANIDGVSSPEDGDHAHYHDVEEKLLDEEYIEEFRRKTVENPRVKLTEEVVSNGDEIVSVINDIETSECDLIIVGRGKGGTDESTLLRNASEWSEFPELGTLGDTLVCSNFAPNAWILVVQQGSGSGGNSGSGEQTQGGKLRERFGHTTWQPPVVQRPDLAPFVCRSIKCV